MNKPWQEKAHRVIAELCHDSWHQSNHDKKGNRRKKHVAYSVPVDAQALVEALGQNDEITAKAIFIRRAILS